MARKIQTAEQSIALAQEFGIKGKLDLQLDETIVPVRITGGNPRTGLRSGFFWTGVARNGHAGVGQLVGAIDPFDRLELFDTPGAQAPSEATHDVWLMDMGIYVETAANFTEAMFGIVYAAAQPEGGGLMDIPLGRSTTVSGIQRTIVGLDNYFHAVIDRYMPLPIYIPPIGNARGVFIGSLATGATDVDFQPLFWTGPKGTAPPVG